MKFWIFIFLIKNFTNTLGMISKYCAFTSFFCCRVTRRMNEDSTREVSREEIRKDVFAIKPSSAPGAEGITGVFLCKRN